MEKNTIWMKYKKKKNRFTNNEKPKSSGKQNKKVYIRKIIQGLLDAKTINNHSVQLVLVLYIYWAIDFVFSIWTIFNGFRLPCFCLYFRRMHCIKWQNIQNYYMNQQFSARSANFALCVFWGCLCNSIDKWLRLVLFSAEILINEISSTLKLRTNVNQIFSMQIHFSCLSVHISVSLPMYASHSFLMYVCFSLQLFTNKIQYFNEIRNYAHSGCSFHQAICTKSASTEEFDLLIFIYWFWFAGRRFFVW